MGRAIVRQPQVFLMDEPLSNLDAQLRVQTRTQIAALQRRLGVTTVYVTHDQVEAMTMGDRVAVLDQGVLQQCATPKDLFTDPVNRFVAGFIGSPQMNLLDGDRRPTAGATHGSMTIPLTPDAARRADRRRRHDRRAPGGLAPRVRRRPRDPGRRRRGARLRGVPLRHRPVGRRRSRGKPIVARAEGLSTTQAG